MPLGFRRQYRLLERLFPASGISALTVPDSVDGTVQPTWDAMRPRMGDVVFNSFALAIQVNANPFAINFPQTEPLAGVIRLVLANSFNNTDAVPRAVNVDFSATANKPDPWGGFFALAGGNRLISTTMAAVGGTTGPFIPAIFRGSSLTFFLPVATGAGEIWTWNILYVDVPGELVDVQSLYR